MQGTIHCLSGRNSSGKSTLAHSLISSGGYSPTRGRISVDDHEITPLAITERAGLGITLAWQESARFGGSQVSDHIGLSMKGSSREQVEEARGAVGLSQRECLDRFAKEDLRAVSKRQLSSRRFIVRKLSPLISRSWTQPQILQ